eukprot:IDg8755t1
MKRAFIVGEDVSSSGFRSFGLHIGAALRPTVKIERNICCKGETEVQERHLE